MMKPAQRTKAIEVGSGTAETANAPELDLNSRSKLASAVLGPPLALLDGLKSVPGPPGLPIPPKPVAQAVFPAPKGKNPAKAGMVFRASKPGCPEPPLMKLLMRALPAWSVSLVLKTSPSVLEGPRGALPMTV